MEIIIKGTSEEIAMLMNKISSKDLKQVTNGNKLQLGTHTHCTNPSAGNHTHSTNSNSKSANYYDLQLSRHTHCTSPSADSTNSNTNNGFDLKSMLGLDENGCYKETGCAYTRAQLERIWS